MWRSQKMISPWSIRVIYSWMSLCLVFPLMLMSLAMPPPPHPSSFPPFFHSHPWPWHQAHWEIPLSSIPTILLGNLKVLLNNMTKLGLRIPWAQCYEVPSLYFSYSYPQPHHKLCHPQSCYASDPMLLNHLPVMPDLSQETAPRFPHSRSSANILPHPSLSSPALSSIIVCHVNYSLAQYPQPPCPSVLNYTHSRKRKTHWVNPDVWFHQVYIQAAAICWRKPHNYEGCISTKSSLNLNSTWFSL